MRIEVSGWLGQIPLMTATVEQTQNDLGRLIRLAATGEEILITQAGEPVAKLVGITTSTTSPDRAHWLTSLRELRQQTSVKPGKSSDEILAEDRAGRP
jgi:prevent-host-death family protein